MGIRCPHVRTKRPAADLESKTNRPGRDLVEEGASPVYSAPEQHEQLALVFPLLVDRASRPAGGAGANDDSTPIVPAVSRVLRLHGL